MVAVRRVKRLVQLSLSILLVASIILLVQWNGARYPHELVRKKKDSPRRDKTDIFGREQGLDSERTLQDFFNLEKNTHETSEGAPTSHVNHQSTSTDFANWQKGTNGHSAENPASDLINGKEKLAESSSLEPDSQDENEQLAGMFVSSSVKVETSTERSATQETQSGIRTDRSAGKMHKPHSGHSHNRHTHWKKFPWKPEMVGRLNLHVWQAWCGSTIHDLRRHPFFPHYPDVYLTTKKLSITHMEVNYGQRVFGYVHPPVTGEYTFAISSDDSSELWLSTDDNPAHVRLVAWVGNTTALTGVYRTHVADFTKYGNQLSRPVSLHKGQKYFIEVLHKQARGREHLLVGWKILGHKSFQQLTKKAISLFIDDTASQDVTVYSQYIPEDLPSHSHGLFSGTTLKSRLPQFGGLDPRDRLHRASLIDEADIATALPSCAYRPSYLVNFRLRRYDGINLIHDTAVYPDDHSELKHMREYDKCAHRRLADSHGNHVSDVPAGFVSNHSLYANGSISVFGHSGQLVREEGQDAGGVLLERQLDLLDIKKAADIHPTPPLTAIPAKVESVKFRSLAGKSSAPAGKLETATDAHGLETKQRALKRRDSGAVASSKRRTKRSAEPGDGRVAKQPSSRKAELGRRVAWRERSSVASVKSRKLLRTPRDSEGDERVKFDAAETADRKRGESWRQRNSNQSSSKARSARSEQRSTRPYYQYHRGPLDNEDARLSRLFSAHQYVHLMQQTAATYAQNMTGAELAQQVWRRFRVRLEVPDAFHVPDYSRWLFSQNRTHCASDGNLRLHPQVARSVVQRVMQALKQRHFGKYSLKSIVNVEENHDVLHGDRYLVEIDLNVRGQNSSVRLSRYFYQKIESTSLCQPAGFQMNHHATVHIIIPVKNQGKWVQFLIDDLSQLYQETRDPHVNLIIVDFASEDINITAALKRSSLPRYQLKTLRGPFQRAYGIQAGARLVRNPHDIIFMCDLHLKMPSNIINIIRKHCVEGKMAFAPIVERLHCGFTPSLPYGFWELQGYGLFAMYKSDFDGVGGMNIREFGTTWGGEDWELLDRVLEKKLEVERLRVPKFYHFFHSKQGMWGNANEMQYADSDWADYGSDSDVIMPYVGAADEDDLDDADLSETGGEYDD